MPDSSEKHGEDLCAAFCAVLVTPARMKAVRTGIAGTKAGVVLK